VLDTKSPKYLEMAQGHISLSRSQSAPDMSGVAPDCPVQLQDKGSNGQVAPNPNGRADVARTGQWTMPVRCAHRQQKQATTRKWFEVINTPNHLVQWHPSILNITFIARAKPTTSKTHSKHSIHSKLPKSTLVLRGLWEDYLCSFVALVAWIAFSFSILILISAL
jgi:hypothetical protein